MATISQMLVITRNVFIVVGIVAAILAIGIALFCVMIPIGAKILTKMEDWLGL